MGRDWCFGILAFRDECGLLLVVSVEDFVLMTGHKFNSHRVIPLTHLDFFRGLELAMLGFKHSFVLMRRPHSHHGL